MPEKKHLEKIRPLPELKPSITEILVANGRSFEPFIKTFSYTGENITKISLGTLVGIFEMDEKSEDSAYIVNFLASVAKKEYFNNPRRGAVESFEAALHKINLALAELVKHGNVSWLGKFHGALGTFEKNNLHFSVTGAARILLLRNENIVDIAEGLASSESHMHPIKTFVEVSSGRLLQHDKIVLSSPELFNLFTLEDILKNALRMDDERFRQFLNTALVNELDMAGAIVADLNENIPAPKSSEKKKLETVASDVFDNVFSKAAFNPSTKETSGEKNTPPETEKPIPGDYIDSKTGHIYIQGDTPEKPSAHPHMEHMGFVMQEFGASLYSFVLAQKKWLHKGKKISLLALDALVEKSQVTGKKTLRAIRKQWKKTLINRKMRKDRRAAEKIREVALEKETVAQRTTITDIPNQPRLPESIPTAKEEPMLPEPPATVGIPNEPPLPSTGSIPERDASASEDNDIPPFMREKLAAFYKKGREAQQMSPSTDTTIRIEKTSGSEPLKRSADIRQMFTNAIRKHIAQTILWTKHVAMSLRGMTAIVVVAYRKLAQHHRKTFFGVIIAVFLFGFIAVFLSKKDRPQQATVRETPQTTEAAPALLTETEKNARLANTPIVLLTKEEHLVSAILLDNETYSVSSKKITRVSDNKEYSLPDGSGQARYASAMDDLRLIFIYTENNELFAWSPISRTFAKNALTLPEGATVQAIGTYLTYLYILDSATDQIYRFPRADGGFGQPTTWLRDGNQIGNDAQMAVNETIYITPNKTVLQAFFRGRHTKDFETPRTPASIVSIFSHPGTENIYALDRDNRRILVWNQDGALLAQYFSEKLALAETVTVNEKTHEAYLTIGNSLSSLKLEP